MKVVFSINLHVTPICIIIIQHYIILNHATRICVSSRHFFYIHIYAPVKPLEKFEKYEVATRFMAPFFFIVGAAYTEHMCPPRATYTSAARIEAVDLLIHRRAFDY